MLIPRRVRLLLVTLVALAAAGVWFEFQRRKHADVPPPPATMPLSELAEPPDWSRLDPFQGVLTRAELELHLLTTLTMGEGWRDFIRIDDEAARITTGSKPPHDVYVLRLRRDAEPPAASRYWRPAASLPPAPADKPLDQVRIAIDPGHIGGEWSRMEGRHLSVGADPPVCEGDLTLAVAKLLVPRLEALGAKVWLVRDRAEPVTKVRPRDLMKEAAAQAATKPGSQVAKVAEQLFYRTAEIRARAAKVNQTLKPDLVLCLHFNAAPWGDPKNPSLTDSSHFHLLINGAYTDAEIRLADQRFALLHRLLQGSIDEETTIACAMAPVMAAANGLPPYRYSAFSASAREITGEPYVWARNLLANRLYECPVVFLEPYLMNARTDYARIQAGDYAGLRTVNGRSMPSIFREYADSVTAGLKDHFLRHRAITGAPSQPDSP